MSMFVIWRVDQAYVCGPGIDGDIHDSEEWANDVRWATARETPDFTVLEYIDCDPPPALDYAALSDGERAAVDMLYHGELQQYEQRHMPCTKREIARLVKQGWIGEDKEWLDPRCYHGSAYHPAVYWIALGGIEAISSE